VIDNGVTVTPVMAFPPSTEIAWDITGTLDVLGRPFVLVDPPHAITTSGVVTDFTFSDLPPINAVEPDTVSVRDWPDMISLGARDAALPYEALMALGEPVPAATRVRIRLARVCEGALPVALVAADGSVAPVLADCTTDPPVISEQIVERPGAGPLWLVTWSPGRMLPPQYAGTNWWDYLFVDDITFEGP